MNIQILKHNMKYNFCYRDNNNKNLQPFTLIISNLRKLSAWQLSLIDKEMHKCSQHPCIIIARGAFLLRKKLP